jgi:soluble lytic murein transglycosylase-like protein
LGLRATRLMHRFAAVFVALVGLLSTATALAGAQKYEPLSAAVQARLQRSISDTGAPRLSFADPYEGEVWLATMSTRLAKRMPDEATRTEFLTTVHYEATRAGLDPHLVLGLIQVESNFRKYALSSAGARGFMQVMPFWTGVIGSPDHNLFHLRTSLRYGCTILRHYLDIERGDMTRALLRYNGSLGKPGDYAIKVLHHWRTHWSPDAASAPSATRVRAPAPAPTNHPTIYLGPSG